MALSLAKKLALTEAAVLALARRNDGIIHDVAPIRSEFAEHAQLPGWRDIGEFAALERRAGQGLNNEPHLISIGTGPDQKFPDLARLIFHQPKDAM
jgi:hypothetical protein